MKLLFLIARSPYDEVLGGAENFVKCVAERLSERHEVHVLSKKSKKSLSDYDKINNVHHHRYSFLNIPKMRWLTEPLAMKRKGIQIVKEWEIDVIIPCILHPTGEVGVKIAKILNKPSFLSIQNQIFREQMKSPFSGPGSKYALKNATKIHVISRFLEKNVLEYANRSRDDMVLIYDGVDTDFFDYKKVDRDKTRKKYTSGFPLISCVSHFKFPQKRQDILVRAMVKIREKYPDVKLLLVGGGDSSKVERLTEELGLKYNVSFLGPKPQKEVREIMGSSDVFAFITSSEGMGIVAVEAIAMGTPIVATNVGPLPELVRDGIDGKLTSLKVNDIADDIMEVILDRKFKKGKSSRYKRIKDNFNWDEISRKIETVLLKIHKDAIS